MSRDRGIIHSTHMYWIHVRGEELRSALSLQLWGHFSGCKSLRGFYRDVALGWSLGAFALGETPTHMFSRLSVLTALLLVPIFVADSAGSPPAITPAPSSTLSAVQPTLGQCCLGRRFGLSRHSGPTPPAGVWFPYVQVMPLLARGVMGSCLGWGWRGF